MIIGGLEKLTLLDYPGKLAAIVFTKGCNFRCGFCHNPELVLPDYANDEKSLSLVAEDDFFDFLSKRQGKLDGVVITGGEPTLQTDLPEFIKKIKKMGFCVKLDTNGSNPQMVKDLLTNQLIDYLAMDIKSDRENYDRTVGVKIDFEKILESVKIIISSGLPHEFRTTIVPGFHNEKIVANMAQIIKGADKWFFQNFKSDTWLVESGLEGKPAISEEQMDKFAAIGAATVGESKVRH